MSGGLFDSAFKKREEAAKKWREENDLQFSDFNFNQPVELPSIPIIGYDHRSESPTKEEIFQMNTRQQRSSTILPGSPATLQRTPFSPPQSQQQQEHPIEPIYESSSISMFKSSITETVVQSTNEEKSQEIPSESAEVPPSSSAPSTKNDDNDADQEEVSSMNLLEYAQNLSSTEKLSVMGFVLILIYFHFSFHSLEEFLQSMQSIPQALVSSGSSMSSSLIESSSSLFSMESIQKWFASRFTSFDYFMIVFLSVQITIFFDYDTDATDAFLNRRSKQLRTMSGHLHQFFEEFFGGANAFFQTTLESLIDGYRSYQKNTPKIIQLFLLITIFSIFLRYGLHSLLSLINRYLVQGLLVPFRWYFAGMGVIGLICLGLQVYLQRQRSRREVIAGLAVLVKDLLTQKKDFQAPVDYLFFEVDDFFLKAELQDISIATTAASASSKKNTGFLCKLMSFLPGCCGSSCSADDDGVAEGLVADEPATPATPEAAILKRKSDLQDYSLTSLWGEVVKEVNKDKRIRTILMFIDGAQRKCWKIASSATAPSTTTSATVAAVPQVIRPIFS